MIAEKRKLLFSFLFKVDYNKSRLCWLALCAFSMAVLQGGNFQVQTHLVRAGWVLPLSNDAELPWASVVCACNRYTLHVHASLCGQ